MIKYVPSFTSISLFWQISYEYQESLVYQIIDSLNDAG